MGSDGELEPEVDENKVITEQDKVLALEMKTKANKAFAGMSVLGIPSVQLDMAPRIRWMLGRT